MSEHTPQQHNDPIHSLNAGTVPDAGVDPNLIDLIAGDPPVPITVWRTPRTEVDAGRSMPARLAARLVSAYSRPGESVVDLTDDHVLTAACTVGGRRHHRAWFTDASSIVIGPATPPAAADDTATGGSSGQDGLPDVSSWFGDDLTDPDLPPPGEPPVPMAAGVSLQGATSLVVACWPLDDVDAANRVRLAWLLTACAALLRRGGCLILVVAVPAGTTAAPEDFSPVVTAAAGVGLGYLQHIVAVTAGTSGDAFVYHVTDDELHALAHQAEGPQWAVAHLRVHAELLVMSLARTEKAGSGQGTKRRSPAQPSASPPPEAAGGGARRGGGRRG
jgi:hypothetical protein